MADKSSSSDVDLGAFLKSAGQSLSEAQETLVAGLELPTRMVLSNAEMEIKVSVSSDAQGHMTIQPVSAQDIRRGGIEPGVLSTLRISFVGPVGEMQQPTATQAGSKRNPIEVIDEVHKYTDITELEKVLGRLDIEPSYVPDKKRWLVSVRDPDGRIVRELVLPDEIEEKNVAR